MKQKIVVGSALAVMICLIPVWALFTEEAGSLEPEGTRGGVMVLVPGGDFYMGCNAKKDRHCDPDERPYHKVWLPDFYIDRYEVVNRSYDECERAGKCRKNRDYSEFDGPDQPVVGVSWEDARTFCAWAGKRLPSEAEWEKAARGGDGRVYPWGSHSCGCDCAIHDYRQDYGCGRDSSWPAGSAVKGASPYGAHDMAGNVWEWVADWYDKDYYKNSPDKSPPGPESGEEKVKRGGGFANVTNYIRSSDRNTSPPSTLSNSTGFRCAADGGTPPE